MSTPRELCEEREHRLQLAYAAPDFVKQADAHAKRGDRDQLPLHAYADQKGREYPTHTSAATWLSAAEFFEKQAAYSTADAQRIEAQLLRGAAYWGLQKPIEELRVKVAAAQRIDLSQLKDEDFAYVDGDDRRYPLRNPGEVKTAVDYLRRHRAAFPYEIRRDMAERMILKAASMCEKLIDEDDVDLLRRTSGRNQCLMSKVAEMLDNRAKVYRPRSHAAAEAMVKVAEAVRANHGKARDSRYREKLAAAIDAADREVGLHREYSDAVPMPEDVLFSINLVKEASAVAAGHVSLTSGTVYDRDALRSVKLADVRDHMGEDFANEVTSAGAFVNHEKMAEILPTLPRGDAELFDQMVAQLGIRHVLQQRAKTAQVFSYDQLKTLASLR